MRKILLFAALIAFYGYTSAQTLYVDAQKGSDAEAGTLAAPLGSLQKAIALAKDFSGNEPVTIKLAPGIYELTGRLDIEARNKTNTAAPYIVEALIMPDDTNWHPYTMPVIQSVAANNDQQYFGHCVGIEVNRPNVSIRGLKFTGNANPLVDYYYPVARDSMNYNSLAISQCYFIGDRNGAVVQGAVYAEGPGITVDHCIFHGCKNAVLTFDKPTGFSITHSIIYGAYEAAVWFGRSGKADVPFTFSNNVVSHCNFFWIGTREVDHTDYVFSHSLICENEHYIGEDKNDEAVALAKPMSYHEQDVRKTGHVVLVEVQTDGLSHDYLNLAPGSDGRGIGAGIFKKPKK